VLKVRKFKLISELYIKLEKIKCDGLHVSIILILHNLYLL
jgi:hypothetical protein